MNRTRQAWVAAACVVLGLVAVPLAAAWACTSLATLSITPAAGNSGQLVSGVGARFGAADKNSPVEVHWNTADGPLLATVVPGVNGAISFSFTAPDGAPGYYTVIAVQKTPAGLPVSGTPARATFALNNPAPQDINGAGGATTVDQQAAINAPASVAFAATAPPVAETTQQAPVAAVAHGTPAPAPVQVRPATPQVAPAPAAPSTPQVIVAPAKPLPPIPPSGARAADVVAPASAGSFLSGPGLALVMIGAVSLIAAALLALVVPRRGRPAVRRAHR
ncbi:MAG TPA: hypothetical protein VFJ85_03945 [Acidimicrobiales bacterium]|nr:hypothetical protein [Acidimicrobiales bacterium]